MRTLSIAVVVGLAAVGAGCRESADRRDAKRTLTEQLVEGGLPPELADCVVDGFFQVRGDADLKAFWERDSLTDAERDEFAELAERCAQD